MTGRSTTPSLVAKDSLSRSKRGDRKIDRDETKEALSTGGKARWQKSVARAVTLLRDIFWPDPFKLGGGNAKHLDPVPDGCERGDNQDAFRGAIRLWAGADMLAEAQTTTWRITRRAREKSDK